MPRDKEIKRAFEVADDGMQGIIAYFHYVLACNKSATPDSILAHLPAHHIQITHGWLRNYSPNQLLKVMGDLFEPYHARVALISIISVFEGGLVAFIDRLVANNTIQKPKKGNYKARLEWAFSLALHSTTRTTFNVPDICLDVDHARRVRNLWMHNNGLFDEGYEDGITVLNHPPIIDVSYQNYKQKHKKVPVVISPKVFLRMSYSHVEFLHHLHSVIQMTYFGQKRGYSYKALKKRLELHRLLIGM